MSLESFSHSSPNFGRLAVQAGAHALRLLRPDLRAGDMEPADFLSTQDGRTTAVTLVLSQLSHIDFERSWWKRAQLQGRLPIISRNSVVVRATIADPDGQAHSLHISRKPDVAYSVVQTSEGTWDSLPPTAQNHALVTAGLHTVLGVTPHERVENLQPAPLMTKKEVAPVLNHFGDLLHGRKSGDYWWSSETPEGTVTAIATKDGRHRAYGAVLYAPAASSEQFAFKARWVHDTGSDVLQSGVAFFAPRPNEKLELSDATPLLVVPRTTEPLEDIPMELLPSERATVAEIIKAQITPQTELPPM